MGGKNGDSTPKRDPLPNTESLLLPNHPSCNVLARIQRNLLSLPARACIFFVLLAHKYRFTPQPFELERASDLHTSQVQVQNERHC